MTKKRSILQKSLLVLVVLTLLLLTGIVCAAANGPAVKVTVAQRAENSIVLQWSSSGKITGCVLYQYDSAKKTFNEVAKTTKTKYRFNDLKSAEYYVFAVSPYVTENGKTVTGKRVKVRAYTSIGAVAGIKQGRTTADSHQLTWTKVPGAKNYKIYFYNTDTKKFALLGPTTKASGTISNLHSATVYRYRIRAVGIASNGKKIDGPASKTFYAYTTPADIQSFTAADISTSGYRLEWSAVENADGYQLFKFDEKSGKYVELSNVQGTSYTIRDRKPTATDYYKIRAYATLLKTRRYGRLTAPLELTTKPEGTSFKNARRLADGNIKVSWNAQKVCDGYEVYVSDKLDGKYKAVLETASADVCTAVFKAPTDKKVFLVIRTFVTVNGNRIYSASSEAFVVKALK